MIFFISPIPFPIKAEKIFTNMPRMNVEYLAFALLQSLYSKQRNGERVDSMSPLFLTVFINTVLVDFGGRYTDFLRVDSLFWAGGGVEGGEGLSAFSKEAELRFPISFVLPPVYAMRNLYNNCATKE